MSRTELEQLSQMLNDFVTVNEAARRLRKHPITVYRMLQAGTLPGVAIGDGRRKRWLIPREAIKRYCDTD